MSKSYWPFTDPEFELLRSEGILPQRKYQLPVQECLLAVIDDLQLVVHYFTEPVPEGTPVARNRQAEEIPPPRNETVLFSVHLQGKPVDLKYFWSNRYLDGTPSPDKPRQEGPAKVRRGKGWLLDFFLNHNGPVVHGPNWESKAYKVYDLEVPVAGIRSWIEWNFFIEVGTGELQITEQEFNRY